MTPLVNRGLRGREIGSTNIFQILCKCFRSNETWNSALGAKCSKKGFPIRLTINETDMHCSL